ncbi:MAG: conserved rane protein of unknown function [Chloroflexi bacterium]|nr:conserved rane protein of unknown function [Chloroflexota bacterium]
MNTKQRTNWWIDAVLFAGLIITFFLDLTGVVLHQWIGIFAGVLALYHLLAHWDWVNAVTRRYFGRTSGRARLYWLIDAAMLVGFVVIILTGLGISTWMGSTIANYATWRVVHISASIFTLLVTMLKLGLHWRWILSTARNTFSRPAVAPNRPAPAPVTASPRRMTRREFLQVMGTVSVASGVALVSATKSLQTIDGVETTTSGQSSTNNSTTSSSSSAISTGSSSCTVRCNRGCSFPGQCHRYVDSNANNLCDNGECL